MKISSRGYSIKKNEYNESNIINIKKELTVKPFINTNFGPPAKEFKVYFENEKKLYIPRFYGIDKFGYPVINQIQIPESIDIVFSKQLRPKQLPIIDKYLNAVKDNGGGGIISVPCGYGKTVLALNLISKLKVKTLVIVHKTFLMNQWKERINEFLPNSKIGIIQGDKIDTKDKDIVIGMLQSISKRDYDSNIFNGFGFVIYDECHHLGAEIFSQSLLKTNFKYLLGLSATPTRADGLSKLFHWYLGPIIYSIKIRENVKVNVDIIDFYDTNPSYSKISCNINKKPNIPKMINNITAYQPRNKIIYNNIHKCLLDGRKILVLSDRRNHLEIIKKDLDIFNINIYLLLYYKKNTILFNETIWGRIMYYYCNNKIYTSGFYLGGMKQTQLEKTEKCNVLLGTFSMASEGFDCKYPLNTIILSSPKSNIEQAVGRILRQEKNKITKIPLIIDIKDDFSFFSNQSKKRIAFYKKNNYSILNNIYNSKKKCKNTILNFID